MARKLLALKLSDDGVVAHIVHEWIPIHNTEENMDSPAKLFVVDDDPDLHAVIVRAAIHFGLSVESYCSADDFLSGYDGHGPGCLVLDFKLPGMTGLHLQHELKARNYNLPVIMISGAADISVAVQAIQNGAYTFLEKPFPIDRLMRSVQAAIDEANEKRRTTAERTAARLRMHRITQKEREVVKLLVAGKSNKEMAAELGLSLRAVEDRRARVMRRLNVGSVAELVALARTAEGR